MLSESDKDKIREEARGILDKFGKALEKIESKKSKKVKDEKGFREEVENGNCDEDFRRRFFDNAPKVEDDCIVAEKGNW